MRSCDMWCVCGPCCPYGTYVIACLLLPGWFALLSRIACQPALQPTSRVRIIINTDTIWLLLLLLLYRITVLPYYYYRIPYTVYTVYRIPYTVLLLPLPYYLLLITNLLLITYYLLLITDY